MKSTRSLLAIVLFALTLMIKLCSLMSLCGLHATEVELAHEFHEESELQIPDKNRLSL